MIKSDYYEKTELKHIVTFSEIIEFLKELKQNNISIDEKTDIIHLFVEDRYEKLKPISTYQKDIVLASKRELARFLSSDTVVKKYRGNIGFSLGDDLEIYMILLSFLDMVYSKFPDIDWNKNILKKILFDVIDKYFEGERETDIDGNYLDISKFKHSGLKNRTMNIILLHNLLIFLGIESRIQLFIEDRKEVLRVSIVR